MFLAGLLRVPNARDLVTASQAPRMKVNAGLLVALMHGEVLSRRIKRVDFVSTARTRIVKIPNIVDAN